MKLKAPKGLIYDKRKEGWALTKEGDQIEGEPDLEFVPFLQGGETAIVGTTMVERAVAMEGLTSQYHAERMLQQQDQIPPELRPFYLVFAGTEWRDSDGDLCVPCLFWYGDEWILYFDWLARGSWGSRARLVRLRK
ncbi:MAG: hypothetical protein AAB558_01155 [Patescibacteria group bacterium]